MPGQHGGPETEETALPGSGNTNTMPTVGNDQWKAISQTLFHWMQKHHKVELNFDRTEGLETTMMLVSERPYRDEYISSNQSEILPQGYYVSAEKAGIFGGKVSGGDLYFAMQAGLQAVGVEEPLCKHTLKNAVFSTYVGAGTMKQLANKIAQSENPNAVCETFSKAFIGAMKSNVVPEVTDTVSAEYASIEAIKASVGQRAKLQFLPTEGGYHVRAQSVRMPGFSLNGKLLDGLKAGFKAHRPDATALRMGEGGVFLSNELLSKPFDAKMFNLVVFGEKEPAR